MVSRESQRRRELEKLEPRMMLAGNVTADVIEGSLVLEGDHLENALTLVQIAGPNGPDEVLGPGISFEIVPGIDTSINSGVPGAPTVVSGITEDVWIHLGGGDDSLGIDGAPGPVIANMMIQTGSGKDTVRIGRFGTSKDLDLVNRSGADDYSLFASDLAGRVKVNGGRDGSKANFTDVTIGRLLDKSSSGLFKEAISGTNTAAKIELSLINGHSKMAYKSVGGLLKVFDSIFAGELKVTSSKGLDMSVTKSTLSGDVGIDIRGSEATNDRSNKLAIDESNIGGDVKVKSAGPLDMKLNNVQIAGDQYLSYKLKDVLVSSYQTTGGSADGDVTIVSRGGQPEVSMVDAKVGGEVKLLMAGNQSQPYRPPIRVVKTTIQGPLTAVVPGSSDVGIDQSTIGSRIFVKLNYAVGKPVPANKADAKLTISGTEVGGGLKVVANRAADIVVSDTRIGADAAILYSRFKHRDPSTSSIFVDKSLIVGGYSVSNDNDVPMEEVAINFTKVGFDYVVKDKARKSNPNSPARYDIANSLIVGNLVVSPGPGLHRGNRSSEMDTAIAISDSLVGGDLRLRTGGGMDEISLERIEVAGVTNVNTSSGNDYLRVIDSFFTGDVLFNGGDDEDTLEMIGNQFLSLMLLRNWENLLPPVD